MRKYISLFLVTTLILSLVPINSFAQKSGNDRIIEVRDALESYIKSGKIDSGETLVDILHTYGPDLFSQLLPDEKKVPDEIKVLFGADPEKEDTDGDGLSDYIEIFVSRTDPCKTDTDENGTSDADEDNDGDGLANIEEVQYGTNINNADSDFDGISDFDEIRNNTDPCTPDTDGDGLCDGDERVLGLNPLSKRTDGHTLDSKKRIAQEVAKESISDILQSPKNKAVPSLCADVAGNINKLVEIEKTKLAGFGDSRALVGEAVDVIGECLDNGVLTFDLKPQNSDNGFVAKVNNGALKTNYNTKLICKYNEDGTTEYLETTYDKINDTVSANINDDGTYYVLDVEALFDELGLNMPILGANTVKAVSNNTMAQADIVFIIDTTGSMYDEINNVKNNVNLFVETLKSKGISAGLALVEYKDIAEDGYNSTIVHKNGESNWFYDTDLYKSNISALSDVGGGDDNESAVDALETARLLDMRASAGKIFILVTDDGFKSANRYNIPSMDKEIELLNNEGVNCCVVTNYYNKDMYADLYTQTGGIWADLDGDFSSEIMKIADNIGDKIVGDGCWIYLDGPIPTPIRLDAVPEDDSTVDTDKDGIADIDELQSTIPTGEVDLDALLTLVSGGVITGTSYGVVKTYKYLSDPSLKDSDYDGINDKQDPEPKTNTFSGKIISYYDYDEASYALDFRDFFGDNETYNKRLSNTSLMFANTIYSSWGFWYNAPYNMQIRTIKELMEYHGFKNVKDYSLSSYYSDDDLSEMAIGYRDVTYKGKTKRILSVVVRGTNGSVEEWSSNFDIGDPASWKSAYHKGFYVAEERLLSYLNKYVDELDSKENLVYWVTGHSRGAAVANILASRLIDDGNEVFAYTFATPATTEQDDRNNAKYNPIMNIVNTSDAVTYLPLEKWNFGRFGNTRKLSMDSSDLQSTWCKMTNAKNYGAMSASEINEMSNDLYKKCCSSRTEVYDKDTTIQITDEQFAKLTQRQKKYCTIKDHKNIFGKRNGYDMTFSTAFLLQVAAEAIAGGTDDLDIDMLTSMLKGKYLSTALAVFGDKIWDIISGELELSGDLVGDGHAPATYYLLVNAQ